MDMLNISMLLAIVGGITILTNIIVQVLKKITGDKVPTNLVALVVAQALILVAYAAMFGFDKPQEMMKGWPEKKP